MNIHFIAGVVWLCAVAVAGGANPSDRTKAFDAKAHAILSEASAAVTHAKKVDDLDGILEKLRALQNAQNLAGGAAASPAVANEISGTFQFITLWQDYLAAMSARSWPDAQNILRRILDDRRPDSPAFFPRSQILMKYEEATHGGARPPDAPPMPGSITDPDIIMAKIKKPEDLEKYLPELQTILPPPGFEPWDWSEFIALSKARDDCLAGFTVQLDLKKALDPPDWGDQYSRIVAMELLVLLPHYLGTEISDPPKEKETLTTYLERVAASAHTAGNLALLQRVVAVQVALGTSRCGSAPGTQVFLGGLSQDAAGQYVAAVISYEAALKEPDRFLPVEIVGARLAAIKAAHPDEFNKGMTTFLTPPPINPYRPGTPGMPPWGMPGMPPQMGMNPFQIGVLPIPMTLPIPLQTTVPPPGHEVPNTK